MSNRNLKYLYNLFILIFTWNQSLSVGQYDVMITDDKVFIIDGHSLWSINSSDSNKEITLSDIKGYDYAMAKGKLYRRLIESSAEGKTLILQLLENGEYIDLINGKSLDWPIFMSYGQMYSDGERLLFAYPEIVGVLEMETLMFGEVSISGEPMISHNANKILPDGSIYFRSDNKMNESFINDDSKLEITRSWNLQNTSDDFKLYQPLSRDFGLSIDQAVSHLSTQKVIAKNLASKYFIGSSGNLYSWEYSNSSIYPALILSRFSVIDGTFDYLCLELDKLEEDLIIYEREETGLVLVSGNPSEGWKSIPIDSTSFGSQPILPKEIEWDEDFHPFAVFGSNDGTTYFFGRKENTCAYLEVESNGYEIASYGVFPFQYDGSFKYFEEANFVLFHTKELGVRINLNDDINFEILPIKQGRQRSYFSYPYFKSSDRHLYNFETGEILEGHFSTDEFFYDSQTGKVYSNYPPLGIAVHSSLETYGLFWEYDVFTIVETSFKDYELHSGDYLISPWGAFNFRTNRLEFTWPYSNFQTLLKGDLYSYRRDEKNDYLYTRKHNFIVTNNWVVDGQHPMGTPIGITGEFPNLFHWNTGSYRSFPLKIAFKADNTIEIEKTDHLESQWRYKNRGYSSYAGYYNDLGRGWYDFNDYNLSEFWISQVGEKMKIGYEGYLGFLSFVKESLNYQYFHGKGWVYNTGIHKGINWYYSLMDKLWFSDYPSFAPLLIHGRTFELVDLIDGSTETWFAESSDRIRVNNSFGVSYEYFGPTSPEDNTAIIGFTIYENNLVIRIRALLIFDDEFSGLIYIDEQFPWSMDREIKEGQMPQSKFQIGKLFE